jgi:hypothetical protein
MGCYDYFINKSNFYDLDENEDYERFIQILTYSPQSIPEPYKKEKKVIKTIKEIMDKYQLQDFEKKLENFESLSDIEKGELLYNIKEKNKQTFVSFYQDFGINKSKVSLRIKLYELSLEFTDFTDLQDIIHTLRIGIISCFPKNNSLLKKEILEKIQLGELRQDRNEIKKFINQKQFNDRERQLDNYLINLRTLLDERKYSKLSDSLQQRIICQFNKIEQILQKEGVK